MIATIQIRIIKNVFHLFLDHRRKIAWSGTCDRPPRKRRHSPGESKCSACPSTGPDSPRRETLQKKCEGIQAIRKLDIWNRNESKWIEMNRNRDWMLLDIQRYQMNFRNFASQTIDYDLTSHLLQVSLWANLLQTVSYKLHVVARQFKNVLRRLIIGMKLNHWHNSTYEVNWHTFRKELFCKFFCKSKLLASDRRSYL